MKDIENRILRLLEELEKRRRCLTVPLEGCEMLGSRTECREEAAAASGWRPFARRERWGGVDQVAWFRCRWTVPAAYDGRSAVLALTTGREGEWYPGGPQYLPYVNGALRHGMDLFHRELRLTEAARPGDSYTVYFQAFSGVKEYLTEMRLDVYAEAPLVDQLYFDLKTAHEGALLLSENDKERYEVLLVVDRALTLPDFRCRDEDPQWADSLAAAIAWEQAALYQKPRPADGCTAYCVGHTHLDLAWLWTMEDSRRKGVRTFAHQLELMERYPFYTFVCTQPALYQFVEQRQPQLFRQVQARAAEGRWEPEGAMWVEPDCNIPSGESFVRQLLLGKGYFQEKFGKDSRLFWVPDTFGFSAALPQILKKAGVEYFATTKLSWNETNHFPYSVFRWRGIDGTEILTYFTNQHAAYLGPQAVAGVWNDQAQKEAVSEALVPFGWGDAGNGATEDMLEAGKRLLQGVAGCPRVVMSHMDDFMDALARDAAQSTRIPTWDGELYLELHRGTLTSAARAKQYNRRAEWLYHNAETEAVTAWALLGTPYPAAALGRGWELIARNQFHDILPGSSVREVYETTFREYEEALALGEDALAGAQAALASAVCLQEDAALVFNTLGFPVSDAAFLPAGCVPEGVAPFAGADPCPAQRTWDGRLLFLAGSVPAKGYRAFPLRPAPASPVPAAPSAAADGSFSLETPFHRAVVARDGSLSLLWDKAARRSVFPEGQRGNVLTAFEDMPTYFNDAWDIADYFEAKQWEVRDEARCQVLEHGPVRTVLRVTKRFSRSTFRQDICFYQHVPRIDFVTTVDWHEKFMLLKAAFPVQVRARQAAYDIQFGTLYRPPHHNTSWDQARFEVCGHKWADLSQDDFGVSLLNDCKYGYDIHDHVLRLTLLKAAEYPSDIDQGTHRFTYSLYSHAGSLTQGETMTQGCQLNAPLCARSVRAQKGALAESFSLFSVTAPGVMLETVKLAQQRPSAIVRLYEACGRAPEFTLCSGLPIQEAWECDLLEKRLRPLSFAAGGVSLAASPYEIKTVEVVFGNPQA